MINLPLASTTWDQSEINAIQKVIDKGFYSMSDFVFQFEKDFAKFFGTKHAVMVNSGSSANLAAIAALRFTKLNSLQPGDEVIVPAVSWSTTYSPLSQYNLKLKFVDIDLDTLNFDLEKLKTAITDKTKAIFAVNLLGNPNDFNQINNLIKDKDILLLEDNCESMGAKVDGKFAGTFGKMGTFSTFFSHHIATMEGGVVVTDDDELHQLLLVLRAHGWTRNLPKNNELTPISDDSFVESFRFILPGYNLRPVEMSGAIGVEQLKKLPGFVEQRRCNALKFVEEFKDHPYLKIQKEVGKSSWFGFSLITKENSPFSRSEIISKLNQNNVTTRPIVAGNFTKNEVLSHFDYEIHGEMKNAEYMDNNGFFIGNHQEDLTSEIKKLRQLLD